MIADLIVYTAIALAAAFCLAWIAHPAWRARIERPKHRFQERLRRYDESRPA